MRRLLLILLLLSLPALAADPAPSPTPSGPIPDPTALIAQLKGPAAGKGPQGMFRPLSLMHLVPGTLIKLPEGSSMQLIFLADGHHELYNGPGVVGIGRKRGKALQGPEAVTVTPPAALGQVLRKDDLAGTPPTPSAGTVLNVTVGADGKPSISWTTSQPGPYIVAVSDPPKSLWGIEVATSAPLVYGGPALAPDNTYVCRLEANGKQLSSMRFCLASDKTIKDLGAAKAETAGSDQAVHHALLAEAYEQNGLIQDAVTSTEKASQLAPNDPGFMRRLSTLLYKTNQQARAKELEERERAIEDNYPVLDSADFGDFDWDYLNDYGDL